MPPSLRRGDLLQVPRPEKPFFPFGEAHVNGHVVLPSVPAPLATLPRRWTILWLPRILARAPTLASSGLSAPPSFRHGPLGAKVRLGAELPSSDGIANKALHNCNAPVSSEKIHRRRFLLPLLALSCGSGFDRVLADRTDVIAADCERVFIGRRNIDAYFRSFPESFFEGPS